MAVACFIKLYLSTQTATLFVPNKKGNENSFLGRCPNPRAFKKARPKFFVIYPKLSAKP